MELHWPEPLRLPRKRLLGLAVPKVGDMGDVTKVAYLRVFKRCTAISDPARP